MNEPDPVELGVQFHADTAGAINGVRFYRGAAGTTGYDVHLWDASGRLLATASEPANAAAGWQDVTFAQPVAIAAGSTYVASYYAAGGYFSATPSGLNGGFDRAPLHATGSVYRYGSGGVYPTQSYNNANYWVDVDFAAGSGPTTPTDPNSPNTITVSDTAGLMAAMSRAVPGTQILLNPGVYQGNIVSVGLTGSATAPIVIAAADPNQKPVITGGTAGMYLSAPNHIRLENLIFDGAWTGLNIDDGEVYGGSQDVVLDGLEIRNTGYNGLKMAGVDDFTIRGVTVRNWADGGACGIDLVGCHSGTITGITLSNQDSIGYGLQMKGGSANIVVSDSTFLHAGLRAVQIGGSTGAEFFRPAFQGYEAKDITVEGNVIVGSQAAVAFASVDGAVVRYNTIYRPTRWVLRILQDNNMSGSIPTRDGVFTNNIVAFRSDEIAVATNVGYGTAPETFQFASNWWYCLNDPSQSQPYLPTPEVNGVYGVDPQFVNADQGDFHLKSGSPASRYGAYASRI